MVQGLVIGLRGLVEYITPIVIPTLYTLAGVFRVIGDTLGVVMAMIGTVLSSVGQAVSAVQGVVGLETRKPVSGGKSDGDDDAKSIKVDRIVVAAPSESSTQIGDKVAGVVREAASQRQRDNEGMVQEMNVNSMFDEAWQ